MTPLQVLDIMKRANFGHYSITNSGYNIVSPKNEDNSRTIEETEDLFLADADKLPTGIYKVEYWQLHNGRKSANYLRMEIPSAISKAEISGVPHHVGSELESLTRKVWELEKAREIDDLKRSYEDKIKKLKEESETGVKPMDFIAGITNMLDKAKSLTSATNAAVSGTQRQKTSLESETPETQLLSNYLERINARLGEERLLDAMRRLADLADNNPSKLEMGLSFL